jgi:hypothetical protein
MRPILYAVLTILAGATASAAAGFTDCRSLNEICADGEKYASSAQACKQYLTGSIDQLLESGSRDVCLTRKSSLTILQDAVTKWLTDHPQQRHLPAASCVALALSEAYLCPTN